MAKNTGNGYRKGAIRNRDQVFNPKNGLYVKRDMDTGRFMDAKTSGSKFKSVPLNKDDRRK